MLEEILRTAHERADALAPRRAELADAAAVAPPARSLGGALHGESLGVIAEIKRRSPSKGLLAPHLDPADQAAAYVRGGASAISVLTEPVYFDGSLEDLGAVRATVDVPILRKDFTVDPVQILEARAARADAVLLIVAALDPHQLADLLAVAAATGLDALVETHTAEEIEIAKGAGASIIGVNNRDLTTFVTDLAVAESLAAVIPEDVTSVAESGVSTAAGAARMAAAGFDAVLVGEALVRSDDPEGLIRDLRGNR